jgi:hypothetical protein
MRLLQVTHTSIRSSSPPSPQPSSQGRFKNLFYAYNPLLMLKTSEYCLQGAKEIQELKERHSNGEDIMKGITKEEVREAKNEASCLESCVAFVPLKRWNYKVMEIMIRNVHYGDTRNALTPERSLRMAAERSYWGTKHHNHITRTI